MQSLAGKLRRAVTTMPDGAAWRRTAFEAAWLLPLVAIAGYAGGFAEWGWTDDPEGLVRLALVVLIAPALGEELLFRAALLPAPDKAAPAWRYVVPVLLFVAWHPPQALIFGPHWAEVVLDPWFLLAVALLGAALTRLYLATRSIWPCVALHWFVVVAWKALLGGPSPWPPG